MEQIKNIKKDPDINYGYRKMTFALILLGYKINHKKVYRLMKENELLKDKYKKPAREFVKFGKVIPQGPLQVLEMDIKFVWVEEYKRHAFILSVIDTFTRVVLGWTVGYKIQQEQIKKLWAHIIETHLQPYDCLNKQINIEVRNDNDSRFIAKSVQNFFKENQIHQVYTHPYTPQENGHIESFHAILSEKLSRYVFWSLDDLEQCLTLFYDKYNNQRLHSATLYLPPLFFWQYWENDFIEAKIDEKKRKIKFQLKVPYITLSGDLSLREVSCYNPKSLDGIEDYKNEYINNNEMDGAVPFQRLSVENRPRSSLAIANVK
ncbi:MAG TPA: DDE-type integrase/transposase/recombinase [Bacteroidales bacterium]|nr:DDE-type integrase/transposase/recombinase [Bacteroidales bacterium]HQK41949.1 DDE-type integrase/transposase/recombinase [bacterium]